MAKNESDLCIFYSKPSFGEKRIRKHYVLFFIDFKLLIFYNNIVKLSEILNKWNLLKTCTSKLLTLSIFAKLLTLSIFAYFAAIFTMGKMESFNFFLKPLNRIKLLVHR